MNYRDYLHNKFINLDYGIYETVRGTSFATAFITGAVAGYRNIR